MNNPVVKVIVIVLAVIGVVALLGLVAMLFGCGIGGGGTMMGGMM